MQKISRPPGFDLRTVQSVANSPEVLKFSLCISNNQTCAWTNIEYLWIRKPVLANFNPQEGSPEVRTFVSIYRKWGEGGCITRTPLFANQVCYWNSSGVRRPALTWPARAVFSLRTPAHHSVSVFCLYAISTAALEWYCLNFHLFS